MSVEIYVDGSCSGNPGPGGFGIVVLNNDEILTTYREREEYTTNNRMELKAILWAMNHSGQSKETPVVYSDSAYCVNTFNNWINTWRNHGWKRAKGKSIENLDLILEYDTLLQQGFKIDLRKVKGHDGDRFNELADNLAKGVITSKENLLL